MLTSIPNKIAASLVLAGIVTSLFWVYGIVLVTAGGGWLAGSVMGAWLAGV